MQIYNENVTRKLNAAKNCLTNIHPLRFRVELLENIFATLFATNEDMRQDIGVCSDSGDDDVMESKTLSRTTSHGSANSSLATITREDVTVEDASHFFSISDDNVMLWSDKASSANASAGTEQCNGTQQLRDPLLSSVKSAKQIHSQEENSAISKTELRGIRSPKQNVYRKASGNGSVTSNASTNSVYKIGFLVNDYVVRDLLHTIKSCLIELNATRYKLMTSGNDSPNESPLSRHLEFSLGKCVTSDIDEEKLQQRISKLQQYVSEATWRFQLASHDWLPSEPGIITVDLKKVAEMDDGEGKLSLSTD